MCQRGRDTKSRTHTHLHTHAHTEAYIMHSLYIPQIIDTDSTTLCSGCVYYIIVWWPFYEPLHSIRESLKSASGWERGSKKWGQWQPCI